MGHPGPGEELILRYRRMKQGDSQLIAAAPDLLEALERVLDEDVSDHAREIVEAAIAKATGRQG